MKKLYIQLLIVLVFMGISQQNYAQINQRRSGEFQSVKGTGPTQGFPIFYTEDNYPNITFSGSRNSALNAHMAIIDAQIRAYDQWLKRQKDVFKKEIEKQLGQNFSDFEKAQKEFYRDKELGNVKSSAENLKKDYRKKTSVKQELSNRCKRNIKLLDLRANEIKAGNVNNSRYGHLKLGSTPIKDLRSLSQIENLRATEVSEFESNEWRLHHETKMFNLFNGFSELTNRNAHILNKPESTQLKYYDSFNDYEQLDLMQAYIHAQYYIKNPFFELPSPDVRNYGHIPYVESYAKKKSPENLSVFHPDYWETIVSYPTGPVVAQLEADRRRQEALNNALNEMSNPEFLTDVAIAGLGVRNEKFIKDDPDLNNEVRDYFKKNDHSKVASDCMNYLLNQYHNDDDFTPDTNLYKSARTPAYQSALQPNRALGWYPGAQAKREGFLNFGNVLSQLLKDNANPRFEGNIIRGMFFINDINVSLFIQNEWLGNAFYFRTNNGTYVDIHYENNNGTTIANNNSSTNAYLNELVQGLNTKLNSSLTNDQKDWLFSHPQSIFDINKFLLTNNNTQGKAFAISAVKALSEGGEVHFPNKVILDKSFTNIVRLKCVYDKLARNNSRLFRNTIGRFVDDPKFNLTFKVGNCENTDVACTDTKDPYNITVIIEDINVNSFELAATILHESIHAELARYVERFETGVDLNNRARLFQLYKYYRELKVDDEHLDHPYMTIKYINPIASSLRILDDNRYPIDYYKSFAWDGLRVWDVNSILDGDVDWDDIYYDYKSIVLQNGKLCD